MAEMDFLNNVLPRGSMIWSVVNRRTPSGAKMITLLCIDDGKIVDITHPVKRALDLKGPEGELRSTDTDTLVYNLSSLLHVDGKALKHTQL